MQIKKAMNIHYGKCHTFFVKVLIISIKLLKTGILILLIENKIFNRKLELILKILNFF